MTKLVLRRDHMEAMRDHVASEAPLEACGLVAGKQRRSAKVYAIRNEEASPTRFRMDAKQQYDAFIEMEQAGWELLAIYHSHPEGPASPSQTDLHEALYPGVIHLIWSPQNDSWNYLAFQLREGQIIQAEVQVE